MRFQVFWQKEAENELARLWLDHSNRKQITNAAKSIDALLKTDPEGLGESRDSGRRILYVAPLGVIYRVARDDLRVQILRVWHHAKKE